MSELRITKSDLDKLPHYQLTLPTSIYEGKRWKVQCKDGWVVATVIIDDDGMLGIDWSYAVVIDDVNQVWDWSI